MLGLTRILCGVSRETDSLRYDFAEKHETKPVVVWNTTRRCNLHCIHCYSESQDKCYPQELDHREGLSLIDSLALYGAPVLLFSGGEPLMRPDLMELATYATKKGMRTVLSTNGTLISPSVAKELKKAGFSYIGISLDGLGEINDKFRGKDGAFVEALQGIRNCRKAGLRVGVRFTITNYNYQSVPGIFDLLVSEDIPRACFYHLVYAGRGTKIMEHDLEKDKKRELINYVFQKTLELHRQGNTKDILTVDNHTDGVFLYLKLLKEHSPKAEVAYNLLKINGGNRSGIAIGCISNTGEVYADQFWRHHSFGNIRDRKFSEIWEDTSDPLMKGLKNRKPLIHGRCALCKYYELCGANFRVRAEAVYDDVWAPDPACYLTDEEIGIK